MDSFSLNIDVESENKDVYKCRSKNTSKRSNTPKVRKHIEPKQKPEKIDITKLSVPRIPGPYDHYIGAVLRFEFNGRKFLRELFKYGDKYYIKDIYRAKVYFTSNEQIKAAIDRDPFLL